MTVLDNLVVKFTGDASGLVTASRIGIRAIKGMGGAALGVAKAGAVAGGALAATGIALAQASRTSIDQTRKLAANLRITAAEAQKLELVGELTGTSLQTMQVALQQVTRATGDAARGNKASSDAFAELGLNVAELSEMSAQTRFRTILQALATVTDETKRASIGATLLGRGWRSMNVLIDDSAGVFARASSVIDDLGLGLNETDNTTERMNDSMQELVTIGTALRNKVFEALAPTINMTIESIVAFTREMISAAGGGQQFATMMAENVIGAVQSTIGFFTSLVEIVQWVWGIVGPILNAIGKAIGGLFAVGGQLLEGSIRGAAAAGGAAVRDIFSGGNVGESSRTEEKQLTQQELQTELLRRIAAASGTDTAAVAG